MSEKGFFSKLFSPFSSIGNLFNRSITNKLIAILMIIAIIPVMGLTVYNETVSYADATNIIETSTIDKSKIESTKIDEILREYRFTTSTLSKLTGLLRINEHFLTNTTFAEYNSTFVPDNDTKEFTS